MPGVESWRSAARVAEKRAQRGRRPRVTPCHSADGGWPEARCGKRLTSRASRSLSGGGKLSSEAKCAASAALAASVSHSKRRRPGLREVEGVARVARAVANLAIAAQHGTTFTFFAPFRRQSHVTGRQPQSDAAARQLGLQARQGGQSAGRQRYQRGYQRGVRGAYFPTRGLPGAGRYSRLGGD